jgi:hypothetical protein
MKLNPRTAAVALLLGLSAGCLDGGRSVTEPSGLRPASQIQVSDDGVITATMDLPFAPSDGNWWLWGRFPEHEELRIPAGRHEVEFEVSGGVRFVRKPGFERFLTSHLDTMYIGPGGVRINPDEWYPALRLRMGYEHAEFEGQGYDPLQAWQAEPFSTGPARGRVVLFGPGRIIFDRHYGSGWFGLMDGLVHAPFGETANGWQAFEAVSDQRVTLTIRPLSRRLKLTCTGDLGRNLVTRGKLITCTAEKDARSAPGPLVITGWTYGGVPRGDGDPVSAEWKGIMVKGGTVQVSGRVGSGEVQTATATIVVEDRTWGGEIPLMHMEEMGASGGDTRFPALPAVIEWASNLGGFRSFLEPPPGERAEDPIQTVEGGPNDGLSYFGDLSFPVWVRIRINDTAMQRGSGFYNAQERDASSRGSTIGGAPWCSARVVTTVLSDRVRAHERRHRDVYREAFASMVRPHLSDLESLTGSYVELSDRYDPMRNEAHVRATTAALAIHADKDAREHPDNVITVSEGGRRCNLKNEYRRLLDNPPNEAAAQ